MPAEQWRDYLQSVRQRLTAPKPIVEGHLTRMAGLTIEAVGCQAAMGSRCTIHTADGKQVDSEVVGFALNKTFLMPTGDLRGLSPGSRVTPTGQQLQIPVGEALLGRVIDANGLPLDDLGALACSEKRPLSAEPINPLRRRAIDQPLDVGIRAINALLTIGRGQRIGLFAGSGVGKSVLLGMMTRNTQADIVVVGLIGERGREVNEFIRETLGSEGRRRAVVVAVPADMPPLKRLHGAMTATSIAEYFRDRGKNVLLLIDSLTRFAQAQREIGLAIGEPPATKGYPPSVFARLPVLVERAGNTDQHSGSITAIYTVLAEGDDQNDPVVDSARAVLDGHIVLSRKIAETGRFPAIDVEASISRLMNSIASPHHLTLARQFRQQLSLYRQNEDLISTGIYQPGSNPALDQAIALHPRLNEFLRQDQTVSVGFEQSIAELEQLIQGGASD